MASGGWSATPRPAAAAAICAATVRSCRSTRGSSASCSRRSCSPTSRRRWRPARGTSPSAILTFSTARRTPCASSRRCTRPIPTVSYDVTIKVEHLLKHRELVPRLAATGCAFVTSAIESIDDVVLGLFDKGHTRADFLEAVALCRAAGVTLVPTFVAFHPWLTLEGYCDLLDTIDALDLVDHLSPIQLAIRLLVPQGSRLLELEQMRRAPARLRRRDADLPLESSGSARRRSSARGHGAGGHAPELGPPARVRRSPRPRRAIGPAFPSPRTPGPPGPAPRFRI